MHHSILVELARSLTREQFVTRLPDPVLVVLDEHEPEDASADGPTQVGDEPGAGTGTGQVPDPFTILPVRKMRGRPDPERVTLGRARTCDVVVRTPGISKLHAQFVLGKERLQLEDLGSHNGTFVTGKRLDPRHPVTVQCGDEIVFGDLSARLSSPAELYELLRRS